MLEASSETLQIFDTLTDLILPITTVQLKKTLQNEKSKMADFAYLDQKQPSYSNSGNIIDFRSFCLALLLENGSIFIVSPLVIPEVKYTHREISSMKELSNGLLKINPRMAKPIKRMFKTFKRMLCPEQSSGRNYISSGGAATLLSEIEKPAVLGPINRTKQTSSQPAMKPSFSRLLIFEVHRFRFYITLSNSGVVCTYFSQIPVLPLGLIEQASRFGSSPLFTYSVDQLNQLHLLEGQVEKKLNQGERLPVSVSKGLEETSFLIGIANGSYIYKLKYEWVVKMVERYLEYEGPRSEEIFSLKFHEQVDKDLYWEILNSQHIKSEFFFEIYLDSILILASPKSTTTTTTASSQNQPEKKYQVEFVLGRQSSNIISDKEDKNTTLNTKNEKTKKNESIFCREKIPKLFKFEKDLLTNNTESNFDASFKHFMNSFNSQTSLDQSLPIEERIQTLDKIVDDKERELQVIGKQIDERVQNQNVLLLTLKDFVVNEAAIRKIFIERREELMKRVDYQQERSEKIQKKLKEIFYKIDGVSKPCTKLEASLLDKIDDIEEFLANKSMSNLKTKILQKIEKPNREILNQFSLAMPKLPTAEIELIVLKHNKM